MHNSFSTTQNAAPSPELFTVMTMDEQQLLIPQHELLSLEPAQDLKRFPQGPRRAVGHINLGQEQIPVYCLTAQLKLTNFALPKRRICTLLQSPKHGLFGLLCDQVATLYADAASILALPECMCLPGSPIRTLILDSTHVLCATSASDLATLIADSTVTAANPERMGSPHDDGG